MHGGDMVAEVLKAQGVAFLFTLVGGHISPILVGAKARGIRVVDTRHEVNAVFAADAVARLTGRPGVAAVTAGPGVTNSVTAIKNAQMAQSPVVLLGGAAPTILQGRGALQDIDQMSLMASLVKWSARVGRVKDIIPTVEEAFRQIAHHIHLLVYVRLVDDTWRGGRRTRLVAEIRQLTGAIEAGRPVTHLVYAAPTATTPAVFHPDPEFAAELAEFDEAWELS